MSHGDRVTKLPEGFVAIGTSANAPVAMIADEKRKFYATQFHLEVVHTPHGAAHPAQFRAQDRGLRRRLDHARVQGRGDRENPPSGRQGQGDLRAFGRRRFRRRRRAHPRSDRRSAHLRVRRPRAPAARRGREGGGAVPRPLQHSARPRRRRRRFPRRAAGRRGPGGQKRKTIGKLFIDVFEAEAKKIASGRAARFLAQGTLYPGRDRERVVHRRPVGDHQVAPQCRRPARRA